MMIREPKRQLDELKSVKLNLPVRHHLWLHSLNVLTGRTLSQTVAEALEEYFASVQEAGSVRAAIGEA